MRRKIEEKLNLWKNNRKQALLVTGARQIGKTHSILEFIKNNFEYYIHIDFSAHPDLIDSFASLNNADELILRLSLFSGQNLIPGKSVVFLDEIQLLYQRREELKKQNIISSISQDIITCMKSLSFKGEYRFILSGSLLGVTINDIILNPTGYLDEIKMYPMDFEEFLWAKGVGNNVIEHIKNCFVNKTKVDSVVHETILKYFKEYVLIGGMPEAVMAYVSSNNLFLVNEVQKQILNRYRLDITTYIEDPALKLRIRDVYNAIPGQLSSKNRRFISSQVLDKKYLKNYKLEDEFLWLNASGVAIATYHVNEPVIPLIISVERKTMRLFMSDVGLLTSELVSTGIREKLINNEQVINYGAPYENVAAQELLAHGFGDTLFYYNSKQHGEVDFLITINNEVVPIEIKSGKLPENQMYNHIALNNLIKNYHYSKAYVFGETNVKQETDIIYQLPIYMISFLSN